MIFLISRFDFVVTKDEIKFRDDENEKKFVKNSKNFDLKTFFEFLNLSLFFLFKTATNAKIENVNADVDELKKNNKKSKVNNKNSKINGEKSKINEKKSKINKKNSKTNKKTNTNNEKLKIIIIDTKRKTVVTLTKIKNKNILLTLLRNLIAFSIAFAAVATFRSVLLCFFKIYSSFFVDKNFENFTSMFVLIFVNALYILITFFIKLTI